MEKMKPQSPWGAFAPKAKVYVTIVERWQTNVGTWVFEAVSAFSVPETKLLFDRRTGPNAPVLRFRRVLVKTSRATAPPGAPLRRSA